MINLIIKGNMFDAFNASHARGIALISAAQLFDDRSERLRCEVVASCADSWIDAVRTWFLASDGPAPYPAGALLFYSDKRSAALNDERAAPDDVARRQRNTADAYAWKPKRLPTEAEGAAWRREHGE
jgi:hypothetical protein